jgi:cytochrome c oxidase subunit III
MSSSAMTEPADVNPVWRGRAGMICLFVAEASLFAIFVVAYLFYIGKSLSGPYPKDVLELPLFNSLCLVSSSVTVAFATRALRRGQVRRSGGWFLVTLALGVVFLIGTAREWYRLIVAHGLTLATNLFGTTFYALVGLHATHVSLGVIMLALLSVFAFSGALRPERVERADLAAWYWHFVDGVWAVVFVVVYVVGR